jgi:hypothetical protein
MRTRRSMEASPCHLGGPIIAEVCRAGSVVSAQSGLNWRFIRVSCHDVEKSAVQEPIGGQDFAIIRPKGTSAEISDFAARLHDNERSRGNVPRRDAALPIPIEPAASDVAEIQSGGARLPDRLDLGQEGALCCRLADAQFQIVGESSGKK